MRKVIAAVAIALSALVVSDQKVHAGRSVTLPHVERFATNAWMSDIKWTSQGAVGIHVSGCANVWDCGGAARFWLPTLDQGYSGLGQFAFPATNRINVRFVYQYGSTYTTDDAGVGPKHLIVNRTGSDVRLIAQQHQYADGGHWDLGIGNGISPWYPNPRIWDYAAHENQPIAFEFEGVIGGSYKIWITKRTGDEWNERLLITVPSSAGGQWNLIDILGAFGGPGRAGVADPEAYFQISNLVISNTYIGPPVGFRSGTTPPPPPPPPAACADGVDNDGDGAIDMADIGCASLTDTDETNALPPPPPPQCTYSLASSQVSVSAAATNGSVALLASPSGCAPPAWTATSSAPWALVTGSGTGPGLVNYTVAANTASSPRVATLTIAGLSFTITQAAPAPAPVGCPDGSVTYPVGRVRRLELVETEFDSRTTALLANGWILHFPGGTTSGERVIAICTAR